MAALSRRSAFAAPAAIIAFGATAAPSADGYLLQLCAAYRDARTYRLACGAAPDTPEHDDIWNRACKVEDDLTAQIRQVTPATLAGLAAKARVARQIGDDMRDGEMNYDEEFMARVVEDLFGLALVNR